MINALTRVALIGAFMLLLAACLQEDRPSSIFVTEYGLGPDKWATAWLLVRYVDPDAELVVVPPGNELPAGTTFDVPGSPLSRVADKAAFDVVREAHAVDDPIVERLAAVVHEIEIDYWSGVDSRDAQAVEQGFRSLQTRYGRDAVSADCYLAFFDRVALGLRQNVDSALNPKQLAAACDDLALTKGEKTLIPELPLFEVLAAMARGEKVVFVDVRESDEFAEGHIPGALNIPLRDVGPTTVAGLQDADYVVSYCVKDFRGFEMAKALHDAGVRRSVILSPYGIKGWLSAGLPVTGTRGLPAAEAQAELATCLGSISRCLPTVAKKNN